MSYVSSNQENIRSHPDQCIASNAVLLSAPAIVGDVLHVYIVHPRTKQRCDSQSPPALLIHVQVFYATVLRGRLCRLIDRQTVRRLSTCFAAWADLTSQSLHQSEAAAAASQAVQYTAREVFSGWHGVLRRTRRHKRMLGWMQSGREGRLLGRVLLSWHGEASCGRLRHKQAASELRQRRHHNRCDQ